MQVMSVNPVGILISQRGRAVTADHSGIVRSLLSIRRGIKTEKKENRVRILINHVAQVVTAGHSGTVPSHFQVNRVRVRMVTKRMAKAASLTRMVIMHERMKASPVRSAM